MSVNINKNVVSNLIESLYKIPHNVSSMNYEERKDYLLRIEQHTENILNKLKNVSNYEKQNTDLNILNLGLPVFSLAYYGLSIKKILENFVSIYRDSFSNYINFINDKYKSDVFYNKSYKKILFFSPRLCSHSSVYKSTCGIIEYFSKIPDFHVDVMTCLPIINETKHSFANCKNILNISTIEKNIEIVGSGRYDVIIYPELNMDSRSSCIGLFRLAPVQINTFGHSESSGMADYFITSRYYETESKNNYTEKPIEFDSLALFYKNIKLENYISNFKSKQYFQIHKNSNIYYCNSSFFKLGKEMFEIFKKILDKDKKAIIVLTKIQYENIDQIFYDSMEKNMEAEDMHRIKFLSRLNFTENMNLLYLSDVFLESYPFGNMNSTLECFSAGLPVVSMPTNKINGRFTFGYYKKMELENEYCVEKIEDYVDKAINIANLKDKNKKQEILEKSRCLFEEQKSLLDWENFIREVVNEK